MSKKNLDFLIAGVGDKGLAVAKAHILARGKRKWL